MIKTFTSNILRPVVWSLMAIVLIGSHIEAGATDITTTETFETGTNIGNWMWGTGSEVILETNGTHHLREDYLVTYTPRASTDFGGQSFVTGDYRSRNVASVGIDMAIPFVSSDVSTRTVTLILLNDNGTPEDLADDWGAFKVTDMPVPPTGIAGITEILLGRSYDIPVPSHANTLPEGWTWTSRNYVRRSGSWARLMRDVDHVGFILGDPAVIYPLLVWDVALDNPRITTIEGQ